MPATPPVILLAELGASLRPEQRAALAIPDTTLRAVATETACMRALRGGKVAVAILCGAPHATRQLARDAAAKAPRRAPLIILDAKPTARDATAALHAGYADYLSLRAKPAELRAAVNRLLAADGTQAQPNAPLTDDVAKLANLLRDKNDYIALVSHELRTPLMAITGYLELVRKHLDKLPPERVRDFLSRSLVATGEVASLADLLLQALQLEAGNPFTQIGTVELAPLVAGVIETCALQVTTHHITAEVAPELCARADRAALQHILRNLLSNAIKYSPAGGEIHIVARRGRVGHIAISVSDAGIGIAPEHLSQLFTRFTRVHDRARWPDIRGAGLGLAICQQLVTAQGGRIWAESELSRGSVFHVTLPAATARPTPRPRKRASCPPTAPVRKSHAAKSASV